MGSPFSSTAGEEPNRAIHGRVFRDARELEEAVARLVAPYNREWRMDKNGFLSPLEARQQVTARVAM